MLNNKIKSVLPITATKNEKNQEGIVKETEEREHSVYCGNYTVSLCAR